MVIRIKSRAGESAEQMMRRFKKLCEKEGLTKEIKKRAFYEKPSERKQRALRKAVKRRQQQALLAANPRAAKQIAPRGKARSGGGGPRR
jgi:small subunit ribosomal protein S21